MCDKKLTRKRRPKPRIKSKNKSYTLKDSALYNLRTKKRLEQILRTSIQELNSLSIDSNYRVFHLENNKREIQAPTFNLDLIQTRIASLLVRIAIPDYLHSGVKGRSNITNAKVHIGDFPVLTMDIKKFYQSITKKSIFHFFSYTMKASPDVAGLLSELCSYDSHIPTGSRLSMPLSFWANHTMYSRLHSLCLRKNIKMSVFVDDLTFSGESINNSFKAKVKSIIRNAGLSVHPEKTKLYNREMPKLITGVIVNQSEIKVRNKHQKAIYTLFSDLEQCKNDVQLKFIQEQLIGRLNAAGQIEPNFKQRAKKILLEKNKRTLI